MLFPSHLCSLQVVNVLVSTNDPLHFMTNPRYAFVYALNCVRRTNVPLFLHFFRNRDEMSPHLKAICVLDLKCTDVLSPFISRWQCTAMYLLRWYYLYELELRLAGS